MRPRFFRWSIVVFAMLLPFAVWAAWDYVEARRLRTRIDAIRAKHEPVTLDDLEPYHVLTGEAAEADRLYRGAAALAVANPDAYKRGGILNRANGAVSRSFWPNDVVTSWPDDLVTDARAYVESRLDALALADRASQLSFDGFSPGTGYSYRTSQLWELARLIRLRTMLLAIDRDDGQAADSLYSQIRQQRALEPSGPWGPMVGFSNEVGFVLDRVRLSPEPLSRIARALRTLDRDASVRDQLVRNRALIMNDLFPLGITPWYAGAPRLAQRGVWHSGVWETIQTPWFVHMLNEGLDRSAAAIAAADRPWPDRIDAVEHAMARVSRQPKDRQEGLLFSLHSGSPGRVAESLAQLRCARVAVATEQYRRAHGEHAPARLEDLVPAYLDAPPIDPFSGQALRFVVQDNGYIVYSVGPNRRDEGGPQRVVGRTVGPGHADPESLDDIGIRVR